MKVLLKLGKIAEREVSEKEEEDQKAARIEIKRYNLSFPRASARPGHC